MNYKIASMMIAALSVTILFGCSSNNNPVASSGYADTKQEAVRSSPTPTPTPTLKLQVVAPNGFWGASIYGYEVYLPPFVIFTSPLGSYTKYFGMCQGSSDVGSFAKFTSDSSRVVIASTNLTIYIVPTTRNSHSICVNMPVPEGQSVTASRLISMRYTSKANMVIVTLANGRKYLLDVISGSYVRVKG